METRTRRKERASISGGVVLWKPDVVLAPTARTVEAHARVTLAEPYLRPESVHARVESARSILRTLEDVRSTFETRIVAAESRRLHAETERERVSAAIDAYRLDASLDAVLTATSTQVSRLMKERGLR
jgi:hypothetical protein